MNNGVLDFITVEMLVFFAIVAGVVFVFIADRVRKQKLIAAKLSEYHLALNSVRQIRMKYSSLMSEVASLRKQLDQYDVELLEIKKKVVEAQEDARDNLDKIIELQEKAQDKLDIKVIEQQKIIFFQEWKVLDSFRRDYISNLDLKKAVQLRYDQMVLSEESAGQEWVEQKNKVVAAYKLLVRDVPDLVYPEL